MILDKLLEKKDVLAYINFRKKQLKQNQEEALKFNSHIRESAREKLQVRINELSKLADLVHGGNVKKESVKISESLNDYGQDKQEPGSTVGTIYIGVDSAGNEDDVCYCGKAPTLTEKDGAKAICEALGIDYFQLNIE